VACEQQLLSWLAGPRGDLLWLGTILPGPNGLKRAASFSFLAAGSSRREAGETAVVASRSGKGGEGSVLRAGPYWLGEEKEVVAMAGDSLDEAGNP
jgi:hypothetical protein